MTSAIGAAGLALFGLLTAQSDASANSLTGVQIAFGPPDQFENNEVVAILGVPDLDELSRVLGPQPNKRDETFGLLVAVRCEKPEGTATETWTRGWDLYDAVRAVVQSNPTLPTNVALPNYGPPGTGTVFRAAPTPRETSGVVRPAGDDGRVRPGWAIRIDMTITCQHRTA